MTAYCGLCGREFDAEPFEPAFCPCVAGVTNLLPQRPERHQGGD